MQRGADQRSHDPGGLQRDRIALSVEDERWNPAEAREPLPEVEVAQAAPDLLLGPAGDAERRQIAGKPRIVEVGCHRELEDPPLIGLRISLSQAALAEG